ncbi:Tetratricopeptide repeat, partial [Dillenia turbinata]
IVKAMELEQRAKEAFVDDNYELAVELYTKSIEHDPDNAQLYADRSQANIKLHNYTEAITDANKAIELDPSMAKAYLRKGTACMKLEEYQTAKAALEKGASLAQNDSRFTKLIKECDEHITEEIGVSEKPSVPNPEPQQSLEQTRLESDASHQATAAAPIQPKYRHSYYQKPDEVVVTIFAKGVPASNVAVEFGEQIVCILVTVFTVYMNCIYNICFILTSEDPPYPPFLVLLLAILGKTRINFNLACLERYEVLTTKVEIRLAKADEINWTSLEYSRAPAVPQKIVTPSGVGSVRPSYPSSKARGTDWDKLEAQVKNEEKEEKLDGDAALNKFFRDIYQNADEDMRRAMSKSFVRFLCFTLDAIVAQLICPRTSSKDTPFRNSRAFEFLTFENLRTNLLVESNGTVLSTNWKEVGAKMVEGSPPDGMELKKWEY